MDREESSHSLGKASAWAAIVADVVFHALTQKTPLDRCLKHAFRQHGDCGSSDRRAIRDIAFSVFRWYGWLQSKFPQGKPQEAIRSKSWCLCLAAALWLDGYEQDDVWLVWAKIGGVKVDYVEKVKKDLNDRKKQLGHFFGIRKLVIEDLIPQWIMKELDQDVNVSCWIDQLQTRPPVWLRLQNNAEQVLEDVHCKPHALLKNAVKVLDDHINVQQLNAYRNGYIEVQDLASQIIGAVCKAKPRDMWWDVCAGGGGKSLLLADHMQGEGKVLATDKREWILKELQDRAKRGKFSLIQTKLLDKISEGDQLFDGVLIDAPCSCSGTWRRHADARWLVESDICVSSVILQKEILNNAASHVKLNGILVYATCSVARCENEDVVENFLKEHTEFQLEGFLSPLNGRPCEGMLRINSMPDDCDSMFVAKLRRQGAF